MQEFAVEDVLAELAKLNLGEKKPSSTEKQQQDRKTEQSREPSKVTLPTIDVIVISSDEESVPTSSSQKRGGQQFGRYSKAIAIKELADQARAAVTNKELAGVLRRFIELFRANRSKVVTKEAFDFLTVLHRQLDDPSIFISSSEEGSQSSDKSNTRPKLPVLNKGGATVKILYQRLITDQSRLSKRQLAVTITDFSEAVRGTSGKLLSKDGFAFLAEVETRLRQL